MKKTLTAAALSSMLVLGLAAQALAVHDTAPAETPTVAKGTSKITLDGSVRERGYYNKSTNTTDQSPGATGYDGRVQLGVNAKVSDQATGYVQLESNTGNSDSYGWGAPLAGTGSLMDGGNKGTGTSMNILQAWVNYKPGPWGVKAGHMPLALGNKIFFDHTGSGDDALVFYVDPNAATHVGALTIKFDEQTNGDNSNDLDGYVALVTHKLNDNVNLGANWTYLRGGDTNSTAVAGSAGTAAVAAVVGAAGTPGTAAVAAVPATPWTNELMQGLSMSNIGLTADGKFGAISYMADAEFQFGDLWDNGTTTVDASGWAAKVGADYDFGVGKVGLLVGYGSGDDNGADNDADQFVNFLTDTTYDVIIPGYLSAVPGAQWTNAAGKNSGLSNLTLIQLKGSTKTVCPLTGKDLSLLATLSHMKLSEDTKTYADAAKTARAGEDSVGNEIDLIATWSLTPGLNYKVEAAYLFVGDVYQTAATGTGADPDDLMFLRHSLDLKF